MKAIYKCLEQEFKDILEATGKGEYLSYEEVVEKLITITKSYIEKEAKYTTEKVDIEREEDRPIFKKMHECLTELLKLSEMLSNEELEKGYYVPQCRNHPPKRNERYYFLKFKLRKEA